MTKNLLRLIFRLGEQ